MVLSRGAKQLKSHMEKILILHKRVVRLMNFANYNSHAVPYFISAYGMPINMLR